MKTMSQTGVEEIEEITVALCESLGDFARLHEQWNALLAKSYSDTEFLTWEWLYAWAERFIKGHRRLFVLIFSKGASVIGIAPMYIDMVSQGLLRTRELKFLGIPETGSDYLDIIAKKGKEQIVVQSFLESLFGSYRKVWDVLSLKEIPSDSPVLLQLLSQLRGAGKHYVVEEGSHCPRVSLPDNFDDYFNRLSHNRRRQFRRNMKTLFSNNQVEHIVYKKGLGFDEAFLSVRLLYEQRWGGDFGDLFGVLQSYLNLNDNADRVEISLLMVEGRPVGGFLHFIHNKKMCLYLQGIDKEFNKKISIGNLMCGINLKHAIDSGFKEYDFLKGDEFYKFHWTNEANRALNISVYNKKISSLLVFIKYSVKNIWKIILR